MKRILIKEDDQAVYNELALLLLNNGYQPVLEEPCDLVLMDINLPGESGFSLCRKIRQTSKVPVIFLTARDTAEDELLAFGVGGDDFIRKPYNSSVLLARMGRLLKDIAANIYSVRGLNLHLAEMKAEYKGVFTELTKNETRILYELMQKEVCNRNDLIENLWTNGIYIDDNTLYVNIKRLREKLESIGAVDFVSTVRGVGYRL